MRFVETDHVICFNKSHGLFGYTFTLWRSTLLSATISFRTLRTFWDEKNSEDSTNFGRPYLKIKKSSCRSLGKNQFINQFIYKVVMDRITATAKHPHVFNNRNRGYFFSTTAHILRNLYIRKSLFYLY